MSRAAATDTVFRDRVLATLEQYAQGLARPRPMVRNLEQAFDALQVMSMAQRLPVGEIEALGEATDLREGGLRLARSGQPDRGAGLIAEARELFESAGLSHEARACAETYQTAAEAYVDYRGARYLAAEQALLEALRTSKILRDEYGYSAEMRRVHLARNVVRVKAAAGEQLGALELAVMLVRHIAGEANAWPWPSLALAEPEALTVEQGWFVLDQVLVEIARVLTSTNPAAADVLALADRSGRVALPVAGSEFGRVADWMAARRAAVLGDLAAFLDAAGLYFAGGPGQLVQAWREMARELIHVAGPIAPTELSQLSQGQLG